jgi:hypothetical protein
LASTNSKLLVTSSSSNTNKKLKALPRALKSRKYEFEIA